jgi:hypothetical protein
MWLRPPALARGGRCGGVGGVMGRTRGENAHRGVFGAIIASEQKFRLAGLPELVYVCAQSMVNENPCVLRARRGSKRGAAKAGTQTLLASLVHHQGLEPWTP